jgi:hypothetical protein
MITEACLYRSQPYDFELQRQRCQNLQRHGQPRAFLKTKIFYSTSKNALAYYNAGVVAVTSKFVGLAPGVGLHKAENFQKRLM